ncbi:DUF6712 family protein [Hymenobacter glacieicola]|uniref:Uncharacterized protein n=1 Tax=Hymenobacter glacieicola TaxID=1562124 RepID=A0ABQ1WJH9_9BACT|nr:hypothetical protein [Hymenobacter glacieicola]GGG34247.1 hypothetical protein GCM10011378_08320 [Hymenobacter glacieicola]
MSQILTKADFPEFVPFSLNIGDHLLNPHIRDARTFDLGMLSAADWLALEQPRPWQVTGLETLYQEFIRPLWVLESARRFLLWHGTHITGSGVDDIADPDHRPVSGQRRAELKADLETKCSYYRNRLDAALRAYRGAAPATTCGPARPRRRGKGGFTLHAV